MDRSVVVEGDLSSFVYVCVYGLAVVVIMQYIFLFPSGMTPTNRL